MKSITSIAVGVVVAAGLAQTCLYTVGEREYAMLFALGELKTVVTEPGLHFKLPAPLQNVVYLDKRILTLDASGADLVQTSEKKNLMIDTFVKWRIGDARRYWVSFQGSERAASDRLAMLLRDVLNIAVNKRTVNQITSSEREKAMAEISELLQARVKALGIDIVDVRMKRVDFTPEISESVYSRMEAERKRLSRCAEDQGRGRRRSRAHLCRRFRQGSGIRSLLSLARGLSPKLLAEVRRHGGRSVGRLLQLFEERRRGAELTHGRLGSFAAFTRLGACIRRHQSADSA